VFKTAYIGLGSILASWGAIATISPETNALILGKLTASIGWLWSFSTSTVPTPAWILALLVLLAFGFGLAFYFGRNSPKLAKISEPRLDKLSLHELLVVHALLCLDGKVITRTQAAATFKISNLEAGDALSRLEERGIVDSFFHYAMGSETEYSFTDIGRGLALAGSQQIQALIKKKTN